MPCEQWTLFDMDLDLKMHPKFSSTCIFYLIIFKLLLTTFLPVFFSQFKFRVCWGKIPIKTDQARHSSATLLSATMKQSRLPASLIGLVSLNLWFEMANNRFKSWQLKSSLQTLQVSRIEHETHAFICRVTLSHSGLWITRIRLSGCKFN